MWGNKDIKDNELWGISPINFTEIQVDNKVYCTYITDKPYNLEFEYNSNTKVGDYLLKTLPNYGKKDTKLILKPDVIIINAPGFLDLDTETLKRVIFGDINIANTAISIFGENLLKGNINSIQNYTSKEDLSIMNVICFLNKDFTIYNNKLTQNAIIEKDIVNFWNTTDLDIPYIWSVIADWICKNNYALKKELNNKCLTHNYPDKPKLMHNSNLNAQLKYKYVANENYFEISSSVPSNRKFTLDFIKNSNLITDIKYNIANIKVTVDTTSHENSKIEFYKDNEYHLLIYRKNISNDWYITTDSNNTLVLPPIVSLDVNLYPISGNIKTDFKIECPQCIIETDLDILACRSNYFKTYKNFNLITSNHKVNAELSIESQWDLCNLINFIINCECEITDPQLELQIADYYKCAQYKIYIDNWLKVNNLILYYEIYKLW